MSNPTALVQKRWNYCTILRDDGLSYGDYVEQLTFLLFGSLAPARSGLRPSAPQNPFRTFPSGSSLKMADEQSRPPFNKPSAVPKEFAWPSLLARDGDELETHCRHVLELLGKQKGMLGVIFRKAQNKIQDPAKLRLPPPAILKMAASEVL